MVAEDEHVGREADPLGAGGEVAERRQRDPSTARRGGRAPRPARRRARCRSGGGSRAGPRSRRSARRPRSWPSSSQGAVRAGVHRHDRRADRQLASSIAVPLSPACTPPASTGIDCPVMVRLSSLARNSARLRDVLGRAEMSATAPLRRAVARCSSTSTPCSSPMRFTQFCHSSVSMPAGHDAVAADAVLARLQRDHLGERAQRRLGGDVVALADHAVVRRRSTRSSGSRRSAVPSSSGAAPRGCTASPR